ncbi:MAG: hypothetical protein QM723_25450 [Myxococcaceae bacterium]
MKRLALIALPSLFFFTACPSTGIVCMPGTTQCGQGCADLHFDNRNCGACGNACGTNQACVGALCTCVVGTIACGALCVTTATDPQNCGGCGVACGSNEVCEFDVASDAGKCHASCSFGTTCNGDGGCMNAGSTNCGGSCVDTTQDPMHCGGCATACEQGQVCRNGSCTFELVAACYSSGAVVGMNAGGTRAANPTALGTAPQSLAALGDTLLSADGTDDRMYQANVHSLNAYTRSDTTGHAPNQVVADDPFAYVVNSAIGTLQVLRADGGVQANDAGVAFNTVGEVAFGGNTYPEAVAKAGGALWVPLYGGYSAAYDAGQKVAKVDISNPAMPTVTGLVDLSSLNLHPFDGGAPVPRPYAIATHRGALYVPLNNLNPDTYVPEGPGIVAKIDPTDGGLSEIVLDPAQCLNPVWVTSDGTHLFVSCAGAAVYDADAGYVLVSSTAAGVVMLNASDVPVSSWAASCGVTLNCSPILPSRMAVKDGRLFVGDSNGGRVFALDVVDGGLVEKFGYVTGTAPIAACAVDMTTHIANVTDLLVVP